MAFIGEAAVSMLLEVLTSKLVDSALNFVSDHKQVKQQLKQWQSILSDIQAVLNDAEEKQIKNDGVKKWLDDLQDLAYDVDDILDEFTYEELRLRFRNTRAHASTSRVRKLIPTCCTGSNFTPTSFLFNNSMIPKIKEVTARLEVLTTRRNSLGLSEIMSQAANFKGNNHRPLQPTSLVDEAVEYVGRYNEKREILDLLQTDNSDGVYVLSIVGMGGLGKTTLAQLVYNDSTITESFDHKTWVCVSDDFDAVNLTKTILQSITSEPCPNSDLDSLQVKLKEKLSGKRFLLVLDDIWNESYNDWDILRKPFRAGTKIIITTRLQTVSSNVDPMKTFHLDKLSLDDCSSIFTQHAFKARNFNRHPQLKEFGEKIVRRCNGLPLAAKAIGSLLRPVNDQVDLDQWERIYKSEIWDLPEDRCGIVPALRLSYHHLPSHLKRCFAYCSILPKDYQFLEEEIILLWRAEGFLQQKDVGKQYFQDLVSRSFFQISNENKSRFVMHDLINDLAQLVAGGICSKLEVDKQQKFSNRTRHASYIINRYDTVKKFEAFDQAKYLRTFLPVSMSSRIYGAYLTNIVPVDLLPRLSCLRVLSLSGYKNVTEFSDDVFENLRHLRYLNFSDTDIKWLPDSLCILYHLETIILRRCRHLEKLPSNMENLLNLHYLDLRDADELKKMPFGIGKLRNLENFSDFVIGEGDGHHIGELKHLSNLRGDFCVKGMENVNGQNACEARLNEKLVDRLVLKWSKDFEKATRKKEVEERVLDFLQPQEKLEELVIENYNGAKFSAWIAYSSFRNMSSLELRNCKSCKSLPSIGRLLFLKDLSIIGLDGVNKIGAELFGENQLSAFASLETLRFESMRNWEEWDTCEGDEQDLKFHSLRELSIKECPQLLGRLPTRVQSLLKVEIKDCRRLVVSISSFPSLSELIVKGCKELVDECSSSSSYAVAEEVTCLQRVTLSDISKFNIPAERIMSRFANSKYFTIDGWQELESLSENGLGLVGHHCIRIEDCPQLVSLEAEEERLQLDNILPGVESLIIHKCERLNRLPKVLHAFTFLTEMEITDCPGLVSFAESSIPSTLKKLVIGACKNLQYLVDEKENNNWSMSSNTCLLEHLEIFNCDSLICLSSRADMCNGLLHLQISRCSKLSSLFLNDKLPVKLKHLEISRCQMLECIAQNFDETTDIECIIVSGFENMKSLPQGLDKLSHLQEIEVLLCPNLISFEETGLPTTNLRNLSIRGCSKFGALPKCINFTSLQTLIVWNCSTEICFPEEGFPTNLTFLVISNAPKIYSSLVQWGFNRLTSLQKLTIGGEGCSSVVSFPEPGIGMTLPPSLTHISIQNFKNLGFMCSKGFQHLTSLQILEILFCPKLTSLPEKDTLLSLEHLRIFNCLKLKEGCIRGKGREWSKIAHIPHVEIR